MKLKFILKTILTAILGELFLAVSTFVAQEVIVDGVYVLKSPTPDLMIGGVATLLAGVLTGMFTSLIGGKDNKWPHRVISLLIVLETSFLIITERINNPLWFAILSALMLILALWMGFYFFRRLKKGN